MKPGGAPSPGRRLQHHTRLGAGLRHWHRRAGIAAALFLVWLAGSGLILGQSTVLGLDAIRLEWPWLLSLYGLHPVPPETGYALGGHWLIPIGHESLLDARPLVPAIRLPIGAVAGGDAVHPMYFVATDTSLVLVTAAGQRIEELRSPTLPLGTVRRIGMRGTDVVIQDLDAYATTDGESWRPSSAEGVSWSRPEALPAAQREAALRFARPSITAEQALIDAHTGRLFGRVGFWIVNLAATLAILLAVTGLWMVIRANRRRHPH